MIQLKHPWEAPLDATWRLPFRRSTEPLTAQRLDMALLSNILATYSFVSGSSPGSAGPGLRPGAGAGCIQERNAVQWEQRGSAVLSFEMKGPPV